MSDDNELTPIPKFFRTYYDVKADLDTLTGLRDGEIAWGTDTKSLYRQDGNGAANWVSINAPSPITYGLGVTDTLRNSNDPERSLAPSTSYTKIKEVLLNADLSDCRIKFAIKHPSAGGGAKGRVYKNGVSLGGVEHDSANAYATKSEGFVACNWVSGDLIQIYVRHTLGGAETVQVKEMRFHYSTYVEKTGALYTLDTFLLTTFDPTISVTNQDP